MTTEFERPLPSYRLAEIRHGDTLQSIAYREMGDASRWAELIWINGLSHPYVTDDIELVGPGVLLSGQLIRVPAPGGVETDQSSVDDVYGVDVKLSGRMLGEDGAGDFAVVAGVDNLRQQLGHAIDTRRGRLIWHPEYGCRVWELLGKANGPVAGALGAQYVKATLLADYRVSKVPIATAEVSGDKINVSAQAEALAGSAIRVVTGN